MSIKRWSDNRGKIAMSMRKRKICLAAGILLLAAAILGVPRLWKTEALSESEPVYTYTVTANAAYQVQLIHNELYPEGWLGEGELYAKKLVDKLQIDVDAGFAGSEAAAVWGEYSVCAVVEGYQKSGNTTRTIYERRFPLEAGEALENEKGARVKASLMVDLDTYHAFADQAADILGTKPSRQLYLLFEGKFAADTAHGRIEEPFTMRITVPIDDRTGLFEITKSSPVQKNGDISIPADKVETRQRPGTLVMILLVVWIAAALGLILLALFFSRAPDEQERYLSTVSSLMRKYGSRMVRLRKEPQLPLAEAIMVADMEQLALLAEELKQPILYSWDEQQKPYEGRFYVLTERQLYLFSINKATD